MNTNNLLNTMVQLIRNTDGVRSEPFFVTDLLALATELKNKSEKEPPLNDYYLIVLGTYDGNGQLVELSTIPLLLVSNFIGRFLNVQSPADLSATPAKTSKRSKKSTPSSEA